jgi:hypothetical protein
MMISVAYSNLPEVLEYEDFSEDIRSDDSQIGSANTRRRLKVSPFGLTIISLWSLFQDRDGIL